MPDLKPPPPPPPSPPPPKPPAPPPPIIKYSIELAPVGTLNTCDALNEYITLSRAGSFNITTQLTPAHPS